MAVEGGRTKNSIANVKDKDKLEQQIWYHGFRPRKEILVLLKQPGDFVVRVTDNNDAIDIVISVLDEKRDAKHLTIRNDGDSWVLGVKKKTKHMPKFKCIVELVDHYREKPITGKLQLKRAVPRPQWLIKHEQVSYDAKKDLLGNGNFCKVYKGQYTLKNTDPIMVAVKICHEENQSATAVEDGKEARKAMLCEAELMSFYSHPHVIQLHGVACDVPPILIVMEYCPGGNLESHLKKSEGNIVAGERVIYSLEGARGMQYLHAKKCIHRDLAARNCLISAEGRVKISDFGLSTMVKTDISKKEMQVDAEEVPGNGIPLRWMSPESLHKPMKFSFASDVWSFGVLMYEVFNLGIKPFPDEKEWPPKRIAHQIRKCKMPAVPEKTPKKIAELFGAIWVLEAEKRPTMRQIVTDLTDALKELEVPPISKFAINNIPGVQRTKGSVEESVDMEEEKISIEDKRGEDKLSQENVKESSDDKNVSKNTPTVGTTQSGAALNQSAVAVTASTNPLGEQPTQPMAGTPTQTTAALSGPERSEKRKKKKDKSTRNNVEDTVDVGSRFHRAKNSKEKIGSVRKPLDKKESEVRPPKKESEIRAPKKESEIRPPKEKDSHRDKESNKESNKEKGESHKDIKKKKSTVKKEVKQFKKNSSPDNLNRSVRKLKQRKT